MQYTHQRTAQTAINISQLFKHHAFRLSILVYILDDDWLMQHKNVSEGKMMFIYLLHVMSLELSHTPTIVLPQSKVLTTAKMFL